MFPKYPATIFCQDLSAKLPPFFAVGSSAGAIQCPSYTCSSKTCRQHRSCRSSLWELWGAFAQMTCAVASASVFKKHIQSCSAATSSYPFYSLCQVTSPPSYISRTGHSLPVKTYSYPGTNSSVLHLVLHMEATTSQIIQRSTCINCRYTFGG